MTKLDRAPEPRPPGAPHPHLPPGSVPASANFQNRLNQYREALAEQNKP